jgi:hypothetical protein
MWISPSIVVGFILLKETEAIPGAPLMERPMAGPFRTGPPSWGVPEAAERERINAAIRGSREARTTTLAEPSARRFPVTRAEQEARKNAKGRTNNIYRVFMAASYTFFLFLSGPATQGTAPCPIKQGYSEFLKRRLGVLSRLNHHFDINGVIYGYRIYSVGFFGRIPGQELFRALAYPA